MKGIRNYEVPFTCVKIDDEFWSSRLKVHREVTLKICINQCDSTGRIANFAKAAGIIKGEFEGAYFNDSDVYKVLEGIAYSLMNSRNKGFELWADRVIDLIAAAQWEDGYINTYFTLVVPGDRWTDMEKHEDYCIGHLIEAAVAYNAATGKNKLLKAAIKAADHMMSVLGPDKKHWVVGHEEPELAFVKLFYATGNESYLEFAYWLLEERGRGHGHGMIWDKEEWGTKYCQDDKPVSELRKVSGHAVRAMFLYTAMADISIYKENNEYIKALDSLWDSVVLRNMYITGGIGSTKNNEGFTEDFDLPNKTAYCETCASIGMIFWNHRMNLLHGESRYADIIEKEIYNGALSGIALSGDKFFYENPLESMGGHHRKNWYGTSCCPTQLARFIPCIGGYVYSVSEEGIMINQYISGKGEITFNNKKVTVRQRTSYPLSGNVNINVIQEGNEKIPIKLRIPGWCNEWKVYINDIPVDEPKVENGHVKIEKVWADSDIITFDMKMPVKINFDDIRVKENLGKACLSKGPIIYCFEETDNRDIYNDISLSPNWVIEESFDEDVLGGVNFISVIDASGLTFKSIPYYAWDNREPGKMKVWVDFK